MSILRNGNVAYLCCLKFPMSPVKFKKWPYVTCRYDFQVPVVSKRPMSHVEFKKPHISLSLRYHVTCQIFKMAVSPPRQHSQMGPKWAPAVLATRASLGCPIGAQSFLALGSTWTPFGLAQTGPRKGPSWSSINFREFDKLSNFMWI